MSDLSVIKVKVKIFEPHNAQKAFLKKMEEHKDVMYWILKCSRQSGKSYLMMGLCLKWCINTPNTSVLYICPTYILCNVLYKLTLKPKIKNMPFILSTNDSELLILFKNGSYLKFATGSEPDNLRGYTLDYLIVDEAAYCKKELFDVIFPFLQVRGKKCIIVSTPRLKNHFFDFYKMGEDENKTDWQSFSWSYRDNNLLSELQIKRIEDKKDEIPFQKYIQEYEGIFVDGNAEVFGDFSESIENVSFSYQDRIFFGLDIGMKADRTVLTGFSNEGNMVFMHRLEIAQQRTIEYIVNILSKDLIKFSNFICLIETNFQRGVYEELKKRFPGKIKEFITTSNSKQEIIEDLILGFEKHKITILDDDILKQELEAFQITQKKDSGHLSFGALQGFNDDCVISTAIALKCRKKYANKVYYKPTF